MRGPNRLCSRRTAWPRTRSRVNGAAVVVAEVSGANLQTLREMSDHLRAKLGSAVVVLATAIDDKPQMIVAVTEDLVKRGVHAGEIVKIISRTVGGGGGAGGAGPGRRPLSI